MKPELVEKFEEVLKKMNKVFTSTEFFVQSKKMGISEKCLNRHKEDYLYTVATKTNDNKGWEKKNDPLFVNVVVKNKDEVLKSRIKTAVKLLKENGYRVLKTTTVEL